jgi:hypothetical protein
MEGVLMDNNSIWTPYDVKVIDMGTHYHMKHYFEPMFRLKEGQEWPFPKKVTERCSMGEFRKDSLIRSWTNLEQIVTKNQHVFKSFITLTFKNNLSDLDEAWRLFNTWRTSMARSCKAEGFEFIYVGVPEFQNRGAVHYHLVTNIVPGSKLMPKRKRIWAKRKNDCVRYLDYYDIKHWLRASYGFSSAFGFESVDDKFTVTGYLAKYFFKGMKELEGREGECDLRLYGRIKILRSRNLELPEETLMLTTDKDFKMDELTDWMNKGTLLQRTKRISDDPYLPSLIIEKYQNRLDKK